MSVRSQIIHVNIVKNCRQVMESHKNLYLYGVGLNFQMRMTQHDFAGSEYSTHWYETLLNIFIVAVLSQNILFRIVDGPPCDVALPFVAPCLLVKSI